MKSDTKNNLYSNAHYSLVDKIVIKKREEIIRIIQKTLPLNLLNSVVDIGTTQDDKYNSSNFIIKNLGNFKEYKSISDQNIKNKFFSRSIQKSITDNFTDNEIKNFKSDLVISNATIEHVGGFNNQIKMCENIIKLSNKYFVICTPNKYYPLEFHTKIPFLHYLPEKIYRIVLRKIGLDFFSNENNLNLLSKKKLIEIMKKLNHQNYEIKSINLLFFKSNLILIGYK